MALESSFLINKLVLLNLLVLSTCNFTILNAFKNVAHRLPKLGFDGVAICGMFTIAASTLLLAYTGTDIPDAQYTNAITPVESQQAHLTQKMVDEFQRNGVLVLKDVLTKKELVAAREGAQKVIENGRLHTVIGNAADVRQDTVCFIRETDGTKAATDDDARAYKTITIGLNRCIEMLRGTTTRLEALGYHRSIHHRVPLQCQLAQYAGNGHASYLAHRDAAADNNFFQVGLLGW